MTAKPTQHGYCRFAGNYSIEMTAKDIRTSKRRPMSSRREPRSRDVPPGETLKCA